METSRAKLTTIPAQEYLNEIFSYDSETGILKWKTRKDNLRLLNKEAGCENALGYRVVKILCVKYLVHRVIWKMITGHDPYYIDHIDGDRSNNRFSNLRSVSFQENNRNRSMSSRNVSGVVGVSWYKKAGKWRAVIYVNNLIIHLGDYANFDDAVKARKSAEIKYGFHKNHGKLIELYDRY